MKIKTPFPADKVYFVSDTHFGHENIIKYCSRPFKNAAEMDKALVKNWNSTVPEDGIVFHLGDFSLGGAPLMKNLCAALNRKEMHGLWGNHDRSILSRIGLGEGKGRKPLFDSLNDILEITIEDNELDDKYQKIVLCHYAIATFHGAHKGYWHLFGHSHGTFEHHHPAAIDVGVDCWGYAPVSYNDIKTFLTKRMMKMKFKPVDHHGKI